MWCTSSFIVRRKPRWSENIHCSVTSEFTALENSMKFIKQSENLKKICLLHYPPVNIILLPTAHFQIKEAGKHFFSEYDRWREVKQGNFSLYYFILLSRLFAHSCCSTTSEVTTQQSGLEKSGSFVKLTTLGDNILLQPSPLCISTLANSSTPS